MTTMNEKYVDARATYDDDHAPEFIKLFLDRTMVYTCAYFEQDDMGLEEAQIAKIDLSLGKCDLKPGQTLLEIGCGCGECAFQAASRYGVNVIALNPSFQQAEYACERMQDLPVGSGTVEVLDHGWEEWNEPVDRIISIGALEHIGPKNFDAFFGRCFSILPSGGRMLLHSIVQVEWKVLEEQGIKLDQKVIDFSKFLYRDIFPGGFLATHGHVAAKAEEAGFEVERKHFLGKHYAKTLNIWAENLRQKREEAIAMRSQETYDRFMHYLTGCEEVFERGIVELCQYTLRKP